MGVLLSTAPCWVRHKVKPVHDFTLFSNGFWKMWAAQDFKRENTSGTGDWGALLSAASLWVRNLGWHKILHPKIPVLMRSRGY
jgi:hypothetical protein